MLKIYFITSDPSEKKKMNKRKHPSDDGQEPGPSSAKQAMLTEPGMLFYR